MAKLIVLILEVEEQGAAGHPERLKGRAVEIRASQHSPCISLRRIRARDREKPLLPQLCVCLEGRSLDRLRVVPGLYGEVSERRDYANFKE